MNRLYTGKVRACILDWSGTICDKYVIAPAIVFQKIFFQYGVEVTMEEVRKPMGLRKDLHIKDMLLNNKNISTRWTQIYGKDPTEKDVDKMFKDFVPMQIDCLAEYSEILPNVKETIDILRNEHNVKIGLTTGFTRDMVNVLEKNVNSQGVFLDSTVAGDDVQNGYRPAPHMVYKNLDILDISPINSVVKVDDTIGGIGEGLNAGCWAVGVSKYSNYMNIDNIEHSEQLSDSELEQRHKISKETLEKAGAHYVIDSIVDLPEIIKSINYRIKNGETPRPTPQTYLSN